MSPPILELMSTTRTNSSATFSILLRGLIHTYTSGSEAAGRLIRQRDHLVLSLPFEARREVDDYSATDGLLLHLTRSAYGATVLGSWVEDAFMIVDYGHFTR
jgi:hypothetical protein